MLTNIVGALLPIVVITPSGKPASSMTDLRDSLDKQVEGSIAAGARLLCGGKPKEGKGAFYVPTVLSDVTPGMPAFDDEAFGPVAAITRVPDVECGR